MSDTSALVVQPCTDLVPRAEAVRQRIFAIRDTFVKGFFELGELLLEARDNNYHLEWGHARFGDWVELSSGLDMGERQAYYVMQIVHRSKLLGLSREQMEKVKISKLKEIFALEDDKTVKQLVGEAATASLEEIKAKVQEAKTGAGEVVYTHWNMKLPRIVKEGVVAQALEHCRRHAGETINWAGDPMDIPDWMCLELICQNFIEDPNWAVEEIEYEDPPDE